MALTPLLLVSCLQENGRETRPFSSACRVGALLAPLRERLIELRRDEDALDAILDAGAQKAATLAEPTLAAAYRAVGLRA